MLWRSVLYCIQSAHIVYRTHVIHEHHLLYRLTGTLNTASMLFVKLFKAAEYKILKCDKIVMKLSCYCHVYDDIIM